MAQKVLINGTGYELAGGRNLIDGTRYEIKKGKCLTDGTGYDIKISSMCKVTFSGSGGAQRYVTIGGTKYTGSSGTIEVETGTTCTVTANGGTKKVAIIIDGITVSNRSGITTYAYTINSDCTIAFAMESITITTS